MPSSAFRIHGAGHGLADLIYPNIDFNSKPIRTLHSHTPGDGGLGMGQLVLKEDLVAYAKLSWEKILNALSNSEGTTLESGPVIPLFNAGGPALVSLTVAAQLLKLAKVPVTYYGLSGDDAYASRLRHLLAQTPLDLTSFRQKPGQSPSTYVFNDAQASSGNGDRFFVHDPGTVICEPSLLGESFFQATFNVYAGTAPLPSLHAALPDLLSKGRHRGALNIVSTVFDILSEKSQPGQPWTLGVGDAYSQIDLLVANAQEISRLAGLAGVEESVDALFQKGLTAAIVTQGTGPVFYRSIGGVFGQTCGYVKPNQDLVQRARDKSVNPGDTVGAGDNFLAGLLTDLMLQILADDFYPKGEVHLERELLQICPLRLHHAIEFGVVAGGLACLQSGGLQLEKSRGERLGMVRQYFPDAAVIRRPW